MQDKQELCFDKSDDFDRRSLFFTSGSKHKGLEKINYGVSGWYIII